jgi:hypothetical protein
MIDVMPRSWPICISPFYRIFSTSVTTTCWKHPSYCCLLFFLHDVAGLLGDFLHQLDDIHTNNFMHQQTTNDDPSATLADMRRNAFSMTAHQLMQLGAIIQNIVELRGLAMQTASLIPRAHQVIVAGRNSTTLSQQQQNKKEKAAIQKQQKAAAHGQQHQQHQHYHQHQHQHQQQWVGTGQKKAPPTTTAGTASTPATASTTPATVGMASSSTGSTFASGHWSTGSNISGASYTNFVGAGSNNSRGNHNHLLTTTNTPDPFSVTASLFPQQDKDTVGGSGGG